jgi:polysaccharide biosynthesis/export protein
VNVVRKFSLVLCSALFLSQEALVLAQTVQPRSANPYTPQLVQLPRISPPPAINPQTSSTGITPSNPPVTDNQSNLQEGKPKPTDRDADPKDSSKDKDKNDQDKDIRTEKFPIRNEFQNFIQQTTGLNLPLFGYNYFRGGTDLDTQDRLPIPEDYIINPRDEIVLRTWGQLEINYSGTVDRNGNFYVPQVGNVNVAGLKFRELRGYLKTVLSRNFRNFELSVDLGRLRSIDIFVLGQAQNPGRYRVSSLSTLINALYSLGGPSGSGSMRRIQVKRNGQTVRELDFYEFLLKGDKSKDLVLKSGDIIFFPTIGPLAALAGSVNTPAIFELKPTTRQRVTSPTALQLDPDGQLAIQSTQSRQPTLGDLLNLAGGLSTAAQGQVALVERIADRTVRRVDTFSLDVVGRQRVVRDGDVITIDSISPKFDNEISLRGFVAFPRRYPWKPGSRVSDIIPNEQALIPRDYFQRKNDEQALMPRDSFQRKNDEQTLTPRDSFQRKNDEQALMPRDYLQRKNDEQALTPRDSFQPKNDEQALTPRDSFQRKNDAPKNYIGSSEQLGAEVKFAFAEVNWDYAVIERLELPELRNRLIPFNLGLAVRQRDPNNDLPLKPGDIIRVFSKRDIRVPQSKQSRIVRVEGEVNVPGVYEVLPNENLRQLVRRLGGFTPNAYVYGASFLREAVRQSQQKNLEAAVGRLEQEIGRANNLSALQTSQAAANKSLNTQLVSQQTLLSSLRQAKAVGRIVLDLKPGASSAEELPELPLEDGDTFFVPPQLGVVNVFGAVPNQNTFIYKPGFTAADYLAKAGGITPEGDGGKTYVLRVDGSVASRTQYSSGGFLFFGSGNSFDQIALQPGDTVVVPDRIFAPSGVDQGTIDIVDILFKLAISTGTILRINR